MAKLNLKDRIEQLEGATKSGQMTVGFALARLSLDYLEGAFDEELVRAGRMHGYHPPPTAPTVARVSFRKNVEIAPFKHEHAEVTVECNGASLAEAAQVAKDAVDEVLGVKELRTAQEQIENAKKVLRDASKKGLLKTRAGRRTDLDDPSIWEDEPSYYSK